MELASSRKRGGGKNSAVSERNRAFRGRRELYRREYFYSEYKSGGTSRQSGLIFRVRHDGGTTAGRQRTGPLGGSAWKASNGRSHARKAATSPVSGPRTRFSDDPTRARLQPNGRDPNRVTGLRHASPRGSGPDYANLTCRGTPRCAIIVKKVTQ